MAQQQQCSSLRSCSSSSVVRNNNEQGCNPQSAMTITRAPDGEMTTKKVMDAILDCMDEPVKALVDRNRLRVGLILDSCTGKCSNRSLAVDPNIIAIQNFMSTCTVESLVVLEQHPSPSPTATAAAATSDDDNTTAAGGNADTVSLLDDAKAWLELHSLDSSKTDVQFGDEGLERILNSETVDAVYISVPTALQHRYVLAALQSTKPKHVLVKDVVSTPRDEFIEQINFAKTAGKFIQFKTMFLKYHVSRSFLDCVSAYKTFGAIQNIKAILSVNMKDLPALHISFPLQKGEGSIRILARYCILVATIMLRVNHKPIRATVIEQELDEVSREPISATCLVEFADNVTLECVVGYTHNPTRQVLTVKTSDKYATMTDFVIPHPDGLSTYRVYDKVLNEKTGKLEVVQGECLDVPTGPTPHVTLWRTFHQLCQSIDSLGWSDTKETEEVMRMTECSLQTKRILIALDQSSQNDCQPVEIPEITGQCKKTLHFESS